MDPYDELRKALEHAPLGVFLVEDDGLLGYANRAALELLGREAEELAGCSWEALTRRFLASHTVEPAAAATSMLSGRAGESDAPQVFRVRAAQEEAGPRTHTDRRPERWIERTVRPFAPGAPGVAGARGRVEFWTDVSRRETAAAGAAELELAVEDQRMILDNMVGFTYRHDLNGVFHYLSPSVERVTGHSVQEWMSHYTTFLTDDPINARVVEHTEAALRSGQAHPPYKVEVRHRDGSAVLLEVSERPYFEGGRVAGIVGVALDITERERLQQRVQHIQKLESLGLLAGGVAHDFNNLLLAIQGNAGLVADELPADSPTREAVDEILSAARRAGEVCQQMLAYTGKGTTRLEPVDLSGVVAEMARMLEVSISKKARLTFELGPGELGSGLPRVLGDPAQISQVVLNLLTNASEALEDEPGEICLRTGSGHFTREELAAGLSAHEPVPGTYVWLEVEDDGVGMDERTLAKMFDPFFSTKFVGRGLGLSTVIGIMRGHEGAIRIWSQPGKGTRFRALFPAALHGEVGDQSAPLRPCSAVPAGLALVVDDEPAVRKVGRRMLEKLGYQVVTAADGRAGLETFELHREQVLFCLLDMTMPEMGGDELFRELRRRMPDLPVLLTSGYDEGEAAKRMGRKARYQFIQKPFTRDQLAVALRQLLG